MAIKEQHDNFSTDQDDQDVCYTLTEHAELYGYARGARDERARIRRELKAEIFKTFEGLVAQAVPGQLHGIEAAILAALDRICPEE